MRSMQGLSRKAPPAPSGMLTKFLKKSDKLESKRKIRNESSLPSLPSRPYDRDNRSSTGTARSTTEILNEEWENQRYWDTINEIRRPPEAESSYNPTPYMWPGSKSNSVQQLSKESGTRSFTGQITPASPITSQQLVGFPC